MGLLFVKSGKIMNINKNAMFQSVVNLIETGAYKKLIKEYDLLPCDGKYSDKLSRTTAGIYVPLTVKLIKQILKNEKFDDKIKNLIIGGITTTGPLASTARKTNLEKTNQEKSVILYIIGGITYAEISALRLLGSQLNVKFIFCTDSVLN